MRHIPTGLYFKPSQSAGNLSKKGKGYVDRKPDIKWGRIIRIRFYINKTPNKLQQMLIDHFNLELKYTNQVDSYISTIESDWEIVEIVE